MSTASRPLIRIDKEEFRELKKDVLFADFETNGLGGNFIIGAMVGVINDKVEIFRSIEEFIGGLIDGSKIRYSTVYFHNLEYDSRYLVEYFISTGEKFQVINRVNRVLMIKVGKFTFIDTYALLSDNLKNLSKVFAPEYEKKSLDLGSVVFNPNDDYHMEYLRYDVLALKHVYMNARKLIHDIFAVNARYTASSTALNAWLTTLENDVVFYRLSAEKDSFIRRCYHGGLVYVSKVDLFSDIWIFDFNSMYPSVMRDFEYPYGVSYFTAEFRSDRVGFYHVEVDATNAKFLFLIGEIGGKKVPRASGKFNAYLSTPEYLLAKKLGYKLKVIDGVLFEDKRKLFSDFVNLCEKTRLANNKNALGMVVKLAQNSLYGKFGTKEVREEIYYSPELVLDKTPYIDPKTGEHFGLYVDNVKASELYMLPHLAAYTTALARCKLVEAVIIAGVENVIYCDTDSLFVNREGRDKLSSLLGVEYGKLKEEDYLPYIVLVAPKVYFGAKNRAKGFPKHVIKRIRYYLLKGQVARADFIGLNSVRSILKNKKEMTNKMSRRLQKLPDEVIFKIRNVSRVRVISK